MAKKLMDKLERSGSKLASLNKDELLKQASSVARTLPRGELLQIEIDKVLPDLGQPRQSFDEEKLRELAASIEALGVLEPVLIRSGANGEIFIVAGERRWRAAQMAGLEEIPCLVCEGNPDEVSLIENLHREDLKPMEEAEAYARLVEKYQYTHRQLAAVVHKDRTTVSSILTLNRLPAAIKAECRMDGSLSRGALLEIARQADERSMLALYKRVKKKSLTYYQVRETARRNKTVPKGQVLLDASKRVAGFRKILEKLPPAAFEEAGAEEKQQFRNQLEQLKVLISQLDKQLQA
jgi:ParB family chromosome partitioning protein